VRADIGPAQVALRHWRAQGTSEYSDFFLPRSTRTSRPRRHRLNIPAARRSLQARISASHLDDQIRQNQSPDHLQTKRDTADAQFDWTYRGHSHSAFGRWSRGRTPAASRTAK